MTTVAWRLAFAAGAAGLIWLFGSAVHEGQRLSASTPLRLLSPTYQGQNRTAPDFTLADAAGRRVRLRDYRGKVVVLHFWTVTCRPCIEELPELEELARVLKGRAGIELLTVTVDENWDRVRPFLGGQSNLRVLFDPERTVVGGRFGTRLFPETWVIDPRGIIRARFDGARGWNEILAIAVEYFESLR